MQVKYRRWHRLFYLCLILCGWVLAIVLYPLPALSADRIYFSYGPVLFSLSVDALDTYAQTGKITKEFQTYAAHIDAQTLSQLRQLLQRHFEMDAVALDRMTQTPIMVDFLHGLGQVITTHAGVNGFDAIQAALILAAADHPSWTPIDVMRHFPTEGMRIDTARAKEFFHFSQAPSGSECEAASLFY
jgi:hypothetical protein